MDNIYDFIRDRIPKLRARNSNCVGTALYLIGETDSDKYLSRKESRKLISKMERAIKPELGYLALWASDGVPFHAGVILMDNPFYIVHRNEKNGLLTKERLDTFSDYIFKNVGLKPIYRVPNKLSEETK
jgi:hypothetical protein